MPGLDGIKKLMSGGKYRQASGLLDEMLKNEKNNDELWYLRGIVSLKLRSYDHAHECFEHALWIKRKAEYYKIIGMAHMEMFEITAATDAFYHALKRDKKDATTHFFVGVCLLLTGDPRAEDYFKNAWKLNKKKTKELLKNFYDTLVKPDYSTNKKLKEEIEKELSKL